MSEKQKLISVIIPVYNTAPYLPRCLDSVINNDYKNLEIICVNDGSTDSSPEILRGYEKNDSRIKVFDVKNGGVSRARNIGLDSASGEYIAFIDSDDWIHRQYFDILIDFAQEQKANNDLGNTSFINNNRNINNPGVSQTNHLLNNSSSLSNFKGINNYSLLTSRNRLNKRLALNESLLEKKRDDSENNHNLNRVNPFRGKFKNLISMKMSKVYNKNNDNADNSFNDFRKNNCNIKNIFLKDNNNNNANNGIYSNIRSERNKNDNVGYNPFLSDQRGLNYSFIDGKSTPHRLTNNSFEYF